VTGRRTTASVDAFGRSAKTAAAGGGPAPSAPVKALDEIFEAWDRSDAPGMVVGVARQGCVLYRKGFGLASLEHGVANTPATRMRIGSASKQFACLAALLLGEEGKLDIDAPATRHLPELQQVPGASMATLRHFMNHTSGQRDFIDLLALGAGTTLQPAGLGLPMQARQRDVNFAPGRGQIYCNGGYHLLSIAIERAAGMPFERFIRERIFERLGMLDTESQPSDMQLAPRVATLHAAQPGGGWRRGLFITEDIKGEGAIVSTIDDMLKWLAHLRKPIAVGSAGTWREMATLARLQNGLVSNYGMGLFRHAYRGVDVVYHSGAVIGGLAQVLTVPEHQLDVVIMTNGAVVSPIELSWKVIDAVLGAHLTRKPAAKPSARRFRHLVGKRYQTESGLLFGFDAVKGKLAVSLQGSPPAPLLRDEGSVLRVGFEDVVIGPFVWRVDDLRPTAAGDAPTIIPMTESGYPLTMRRLPARATSLASAERLLAGHYRCHDLNADATVSMENDVLVLRIVGSLGMLRLAVQPLSQSLVALKGLDEPQPAHYAATLVAAGGRATAFRMNSMRTRHLLFERVIG
jgi:CubicO group peptidase (beta-lactamase class C family)